MSVCAENSPAMVFWPSQSNRVIAIDVEITGTGETGRIIQVGMMSNLAPVPMHQVITYEDATDPDYMERKCREKGISQKDLDKAVSFKSYRLALKRDLEGAVVVTYNGGNDLCHLAREFWRSTSSPMEINLPDRCIPTYKSIIDVKKLAMQLIPRDKIKGYSLWDVCKYFGVLEDKHLVDRHNAKIDAAYTFKVLIMLMNMAPGSDVFPEGMVTTQPINRLPPWVSKAFPAVAAATEEQSSSDEAEEETSSILSTTTVAEAMEAKRQERAHARAVKQAKNQLVHVPYLLKYTKAKVGSNWKISLVQIYAASKHHMSYKQAGLLPSGLEDWKSAGRMVREFALGNEKDYFGFATTVQSLSFVVDYFMFNRRRMKAAKHFFENNWNQEFFDMVGHVGPDPLTDEHRAELLKIPQRPAHPLLLMTKKRKHEDQ